MRWLLAPYVAEIQRGHGQSLWPVIGFGVSMIVDYGVIYYSFTLLAPRIAQDLSWSLSFTYSGLAAAFFCSGLAAPYAGKLLDRHGGRIVMSWGTLIAAAAMALLAAVEGPVSYVATVIAIEVAGTTVLYNAAFTTLTQIYGHGARRAITFTTLTAAFSSTLFWPLTSALLTHLDWRTVTLILAGLMILISLPIHLLLPRPRSDSRPVERGTSGGPHGVAPILLTDDRQRRRAFVLLSLSFSLSGFVIASLPLHLISVLTSLGFTGAVAVTLGSLIGPSQFLVRLIEMIVGQRLSAITVGLVAAALIPLGLLILMLGGTSLAAGVLFAVVYGMGQGLESIAKGIVPLALFGPTGYGTMLGRIAMAGLVVSAGAPWVFSLVRESHGPIAALALAAAAGLIATLAYLGIPKPSETPPP
ncbi:MAG: MFS transporter [Hyphomicrobiaceae bacterium]